MAPTRTFDRIARFDERSRNYPIRALLPAAGTVPRYKKVWRGPEPILDQGEEGACAPHGGVHEALASPVRVNLARTGIAALGFPTDPQALAFALYDWCRRNDEWEGEDYAGTSVLAVAQAMTMLRLYREYRWGFTRDDLVDSIIAHGPAILGIPWHESMYEAPGGEVTVSGPIVGGHCILATGYDPAHVFLDGTVAEAVLLTNSWSAAWGINGTAWIRLDDLWDRLLRNDGETLIPVRRAYGRPVVPRVPAAPVRAVLGRATKWLRCLRRR